jgi:hypothetical protein
MRYYVRRNLQVFLQCRHMFEVRVGLVTVHIPVENAGMAESLVRISEDMPLLSSNSGESR